MKISRFFGGACPTVRSACVGMAMLACAAVCIVPTAAGWQTVPIERRLAMAPATRGARPVRTEARTRCCVSVSVEIGSNATLPH